MLEEIKHYIKEFNIDTKKMFKEFFNKETNKKQRANMWTFSRLISSFISVICSSISVIFHIPIMFLVAAIVTVLGALTDFFDGRSARKYNAVSEYGKLLDQITDKIFSIMISINLALFYPNFSILLIGEIIIAVINIYYKIKYPKIHINSTIIGKIKQFPLFITLGFGFLTPISKTIKSITNICIIITFIIQIITAISYVVKKGMRK